MAVKEPRTRLIRRWRKNMDVLDDSEYVDMLTTLSEVRCAAISTRTSTSTGTPRSSP